jgi:hypothetical protein
MSSRNNIPAALVLPAPDRGRQLAELRQSSASGPHGGRNKQIIRQRERRGTKQELRGLRGRRWN